VLLKRLNELRNDTIVQRERVYDVYAGQVSGGNRGGLK
jgi:hypothetical protein